MLSATAGAAVVVTDDTYANDTFSLSYPSGWRVITSPAGSPPSVTLVAPGDCGLIVVASTPLDLPTLPESCTDEDILSDARSVNPGNTTVNLAGSATLSQWDSFLVAFERIAGSVRSS